MNSNNELPQRIIFFDTETYETELDNTEKELNLKLGALCYVRPRQGSLVIQETWHDFYDINDFWNIVFDYLKPKTKIYLVAHNVAFDFRVLKGFDYMRKNSFIIHKFISQATMNIWEFRCGNKTICVLDNMNYFKSSLAVLGDSIGIPKMEMPTDNDGELLRYCRNDVKIMVEAWKIYLRFIKDNDLGNFAKTVAGQAFNAFRHRFMRHTIQIHTWERAIKMERESYHGGRTECFYIGKLPKADYYLLDVNSMYPSVMAENKYPTKVLGNIDNITPLQLGDLLRTKCITAKVLLKTNEPVFPIKKDGKLIFPVGVFEAHLTSRELAYAVENNMILEVIDAIFYEKQQLFLPYVKFFYQKRKEYKEAKNEAFSYLCKIFLNSLYGKFGQRNLAYDRIGTTDRHENGVIEYYDENNNLIRERVINGVVERSAGMKEGYDSFVGVAAHVCADARMKLWEYFKLAGRENVFYCDTDSMIVNQKGFDNCQSVISPKLGFLSLKDMTDNVSIFGPKDYIFNKDIVMKGIRKDAKEISPLVYSQLRFEGLAGALRKNRLDKMIISNVNKKLSRQYNKGVVKKNGFVEPFKLEYQQSLIQ